MGKKKKRYVLTEKQLNDKEEAAKRRAEKARLKLKHECQSGIIMLIIGLVFFIASLSLTGVCVARMHNYETNYARIEGTVVDYSIYNRTGIGRRYTLIIAYYYGGQEYKFSDTTSYNVKPTKLLGTATDIYVNPINPEKVKRVITADDLSIVSVFLFSFSTLPYVVGGAILFQKKGASFKKRVFTIWLPMFSVCVLTVVLFGIGLPASGFGAVFSMIDGAIGYAVVAGLSFIAALTDGLIDLKCKKG